jgi:hypothetical protein
MLIDDPDNSDPTVFTLVPEQTAQGITKSIQYADISTRKIKSETTKNEDLIPILKT